MFQRSTLNGNYISLLRSFRRFFALRAINISSLRDWTRVVRLALEISRASKRRLFTRAPTSDFNHISQLWALSLDSMF